jgi:NADH dehydrogenase
MILVTGATGFIGTHLLPRLIRDAGLKIRMFVRPGSDLEGLPRGLTLSAMVGDIGDSEALLSAMSGVHTIIHLVGTDHRGRHAHLKDVDVAAARALTAAAVSARVGRIIFVSRIGADSASGFSILKAKGEVEDIFKNSGIAYTILRPSILFGRGDYFSEHVAMLGGLLPIYGVPGDGDMVLQPLWIEDFITCIAMCLDHIDTIDSVITLGGPELLPYRRAVMRVFHVTGSSTSIVGLPPLIHRLSAWFLDGLFARWPITESWSDLLAMSQTSELGTIERLFGFRPTAFDIGVLGSYLANRNYALELARYAMYTPWH